MSTINIGSLVVNGNVFLAPMCDVTSLPFRVMCKRYGAAVVYSEMVHADAYIMDSKRTTKRVYFLEKERPVGIQLTGSSVEKIKLAAQKAEAEIRPDIIDINFGCPAYNVMKGGQGAAVLNNTEKLKQIVSTLSDSIKTPLTCKMRILPDEKDTLRAAKLISQNGAKALTVHGRTARQGYSGKADWNIVRKIRSMLGIPVVLNGDITDEESAKEAIKGVDAIMIGRAAIGNPYIFSRINHFLATGEKLGVQTFDEKVKDFIKIIYLCRKHGYKDIKNMKMLAQNTIKGYKGAREMRKRISGARSIDGIIEIVSTAL